MGFGQFGVTRRKLAYASVIAAQQAAEGNGMKALSIKQPWAWLIANGLKDIENRDWRYPPKFRGPLLIHAGKRPTILDDRFIELSGADG